jgi:hypothetical protein
VTTPDLPGVEVGSRFVVLGTEIGYLDGRIRFTGEPSGRPPLPEETVVPRVGTHALERKQWTDADRDRARELWATGLSWAQIAGEIGCHKSSVRDWLCGAG